MPRGRRAGGAERRFAALLAALLLALSGCSSPPVRTEDVSSPDRYMEFNAYVRNDLDEAFYAVFPSEPGEQAQYRYRYACAPLGDPDYYIWLRAEFPSEEAYRAETDRLRPALQGAEAGADGAFFVLGTAEDLMLLLDDAMQDGRDYTVLAVREDDAAQTVEYVYLHEYDSSPHREGLREGALYGRF